MRLKTNMRGLNEAWFETRRIQLTDEEYNDLRRACKPEVYLLELELEKAPKVSPVEIAHQLEKQIELAEIRAAEDIKNSGEIESAQGEIAYRLGDSAAFSVMRHIRGR
jgi:hypothetical protein